LRNLVTTAITNVCEYMAYESANVYVIAGFMILTLSQDTLLSFEKINKVSCIMLMPMLRAQHSHA